MKIAALVGALALAAGCSPTNYTVAVHPLQVREQLPSWTQKATTPDGQIAFRHKHSGALAVVVVTTADDVEQNGLKRCAAWSEELTKEEIAFRNLPLIKKTQVSFGASPRTAGSAVVICATAADGSTLQQNLNELASWVSLNELNITAL